MPGQIPDLDADLKAQLESVLAAYFKRMQDARGTEAELERCQGARRDLQARADSQKDLIQSLEQQLLASQAREASALERIGIITGVMQSHQASIAGVVGNSETAPTTPSAESAPANNGGQS